MTATYRFDGETRELGLLAQLIEAAIRAAQPQAGRDRCAAACLAVHEVVVNAMRHAYGGRGGPIDVTISTEEQGLHVRVTDWGRARTRRPTTDLPDAPRVHGYGLAIVGAIAHDVSYRRSDGANHWDLEFGTGEEATP